jgi:Lrp/AsnC family leucine-responsive transcriptional regulator
MYTAIIDADRIDRSFAVYCNISFKQINREVADEFREIVSSWEEVTECYNVSGDCDFLMKVNVRGMKEYQEFILYKVGELDYVGRVQSVFVMETLKQNYGIRL